jgi:hypothetical protein
VIFDQCRAWDAQVTEFLKSFIADGRLEFFDGSVASDASWVGLEQLHGNQFTHVVSGTAPPWHPFALSNHLPLATIRP